MLDISFLNLQQIPDWQEWYYQWSPYYPHSNRKLQMLPNTQGITKGCESQTYVDVYSTI